MRKHDQSSAAVERDRKGRFSARRKRATVLRLLRGEDLESVSRELGITAALLFSAVLLFQIVTLPVEFDATARAKKLVVAYGIISERERGGGWTAC